MLHTHLENFKSKYPIVAVALKAQPIKPAKEQFGLFETTLRNPHQLSETLARLTGLLGADHVGTPVLEETHRPDAFRMEPFAWQVGAIEFTRRRVSNQHFGQRCVDFGQVYLHPSCWMKTALCTFAAQMLAAKSSICAAHI